MTTPSVILALVSDLRALKSALHAPRSSGHAKCGFVRIAANRGHRSYERGCTPAGCIAGFQEPSCRIAVGLLGIIDHIPLPPMNTVGKREQCPS
jgi:hypothetical protein